MKYKLAVIAEPISSLNTATDSSISIMRAAFANNWQVFFIDKNQVSIIDNQVVAHAKDICLSDTDDWYRVENQCWLNLSEVDAVLMRQDPPVDENYLHISHLLTKINQSILVINNPRSLRDCNEKLFALEFPQLCPPSIVTSNKSVLKKFYTTYSNIVIKPINGAAGKGVFNLTEYDPNFNVIWENTTEKGKKPIVAQQFIPEITQGDKRIILINGKPLPKALLRIPSKEDFRANLATGGKGVAVDLTKRDEIICNTIAPTLKEKGLIFVGIDVIGDYLTEINVTSPTVLVEIAAQTSIDGEADLIKQIENILSIENEKTTS
jgi:glutathione synthase